MNSENEELDFSAILMSSIHDIKNSLSMLLTTLDDATQTQELSECPLGEQITQLQYEAKRVNNDLVQLLTLYKISDDHFEPNVAYHDVDDFIDELAIEYAPLLKFNNIELLTECDPELSWFFDRFLISGVINNVLNNEIRYGKDRTKLTADEEDGYLVIRIHDNGPGYPEQMLSQEGMQSNPANPTTGSTGLGLYFSTLSAQAHHNKERRGFIKIGNNSDLGGGCFAIYLP